MSKLPEQFVVWSRPVQWWLFVIVVVAAAAVAVAAVDVVVVLAFVVVEFAVDNEISRYYTY